MSDFLDDPNLNDVTDVQESLRIFLEKERWDEISESCALLSNIERSAKLITNYEFKSHNKFRTLALAVGSSDRVIKGDYPLSNKMDCANVIKVSLKIARYVMDDEEFIKQRKNDYEALVFYAERMIVKLSHYITDQMDSILSGVTENKNGRQ